MCCKENFELDKVFFIYNPIFNKYDIYRYRIDNNVISVSVNKKDFNKNDDITFDNLDDFYLFKKNLLKSNCNFSNIFRNIFYISGIIFFISVFLYFCINSEKLELDISNKNEISKQDNIVNMSEIDPIHKYIENNIPDENVKIYVENLIKKDMKNNIQQPKQVIEENKVPIVPKEKPLLPYSDEKSERVNKASNLLNKIKNSKPEINDVITNKPLESEMDGNKIKIERKDVISNIPSSESWLTKGASIHLPLPGGGKNIRSVEDLLNFGESN